MTSKSTTNPASSVPRAVAELVGIASLGGGRGISLSEQVYGDVNKTGKPFEVFARNMFAGCLGSVSSAVDESWEKTFSWRGSANHPPDFIIRSGDAVEVKKQIRKRNSASAGTSIALNSSSPKRTLKSSDPRIEEACRKCEDWSEKDFLYFIGQVTTEYVEAVWLIDGRCMVDVEHSYLDLFDRLARMISDLGGTKTKELGRFNKVDTLGRTALRVRPMWSLKHPRLIFESHFLAPRPGWFVLNVLMSQEKWSRYSKADLNLVEGLSRFGVHSKSIEHEAPDGANNRQTSHLITWEIEIK